MDNFSSKKNKGCLETESFEVTVVNDPKLKPFLNTFHATGQNIEQKKLGKIFGIIQIDDHSDGSAYLPNMLTQIIKKEYFRNKNRDCGKSFELALHKTNLALTELTQHEIVKWMGNLNAAIGVVCGKELHFTQIGRGRILFLKNKKISSIGGQSSKDEEYHPMKTFASISAGKIEDKNKLIFTIEKTFDTLKKDELERHFKTFNSKEFDNIISSTLRNEASDTGMVVLNIHKKAKTTEAITIEPEFEPPEEETNFFGETEAKKEKKRAKNKEKEFKKEKKLKEKKIKIEEDFNKSPFENEPEIFLKETDKEKKFEEPKSDTKQKSMEAAREFYDNATDKIKALIKNSQEKAKNIPFEKVKPKKEDFEKVTEKTKDIFKKVDKEKLATLRNKFIRIFKKINFEKIKNKSKKAVLKIEPGFKNLKEKTISKSKSLLKNKKVQGAISKATDKIGVETTFSENTTKSDDPHDFFKPRKRPSLRKNKASLGDKFQTHYNKLQKTLKKMLKNRPSNKTLLIIVGFLLGAVILIAAFAFIKKSNNNQESKNNTPQQNQGGISQNNSTTSSQKLINIDRDIKDSVMFEDDLFLLSDKNSLIEYSTRDNVKKEINLPGEIANPEFLSAMEDLQLVFIISQNEVFSYSPVTGKFEKHQITMPLNPEIKGVGTYLTYLYLLDKTSNQIYRYHRAPGGFGPATNWVKEASNFQSSTDMDVSGSVYTASSENKITKYFNYKKEKDFDLPENFQPDKIRAHVDASELFALDKKQGKIIKLSDEGNFESSFENEKFKDSHDFSVDFKNKKVFIITDNNELEVFEY